MLEKEMEEERSASDGGEVGRASMVSQTQRVQRRKKKSSKIKFYYNKSKFNIQRVYHEVFVFLVPSFIGVLQVIGTQASFKSLLETHQASVWIFVSAIIIYCIAFAADLMKYFKRSSHSKLVSSIAISAGSLSSVALLSFFLPCRFRHLVFIPWVFVSIIFVVYRHADLIQNESIGLYHRFSGIWDRFKGRNSSDQRSLLPVHVQRN